jgi:hypothetical protein
MQNQIFSNIQNSNQINCVTPNFNQQINYSMQNEMNYNIKF